MQSLIGLLEEAIGGAKGALEAIKEGSELERQINEWFEKVMPDGKDRRKFLANGHNFQEVNNSPTLASALRERISQELTLYETTRYILNAGQTSGFNMLWKEEGTLDSALERAADRENFFERLKSLQEPKKRGLSGILSLIHDLTHIKDDNIFDEKGELYRIEQQIFDPLRKLSGLIELIRTQVIEAMLPKVDCYAETWVAGQNSYFTIVYSTPDRETADKIKEKIVKIYQDPDAIVPEVEVDGNILIGFPLGMSADSFTEAYWDWIKDSINQELTADMRFNTSAVDAWKAPRGLAHSATMTIRQIQL